MVTFLKKIKFHFCQISSLTRNQFRSTELCAFRYWEDPPDVKKWLLVLISTRELFVPGGICNDYYEDDHEENEDFHQGSTKPAML